MLSECRKALRIVSTEYDGELCDLMDAAAHDLTIAGVVLPGTVSFEVSQSGITDTSTLADNLCKRAIFSYVDWLFFRNAGNEDRKREIYNIQKEQLMHASGYTDYDDAEEAEAPEEAEEGDG